MKRLGMAKRLVALLCVVLLYPACSYYTRRNHQLNEHLVQGDIKGAYEIISTHEKKWEKGKDRVLYYMNRGALAWMLNKNEESSKYLLKADYYLEDLNTNYSREALSYLINPRVKEYAGEDYEAIMLNYYQVMNFIQMNDLEKARIQARRIVLTLNRIDDKYKDWQGNNKSVKLQHSAFAHTLLGLVYELTGDDNAAFIAYRNAYKYYEEDYSQFFGLDAPLQLKKDLIRTAYLSGFYNDVDYYSKKFNLPFDPKTDTKGGNLIFFWNNGLTPVKEEVSANFTMIKGQGGWYTFTNAQYGYSIPIFVGNGNGNGDFSDIEFVRAAFPTLVERPPFYQSATLTANGVNYPFETLEDVNATAFKTLNDRMLAEFGKTLLRLATKKLAEHQLRKENENAGAALGIVNAITEQADTRGWYSIPHTISYTRITLPQGPQEVKLALRSPNGIDTAMFKFDIKPGKTYIQPYQTIQSQFNTYF